MNEENLNHKPPMFVPKQFAQNPKSNEQTSQEKKQETPRQKIPFLPPVGGDSLPKNQNSQTPHNVYPKNTSHNTNNVSTNNNPQKQPSDNKIKLDFGQEPSSNSNPSFSSNTPNATNTNKPDSYLKPRYDSLNTGNTSVTNQPASYQKPKYDLPQNDSSHSSGSKNSKIAEVANILAKQDEILTQLRSHNLSISKLKKEFKQITHEQSGAGIQKSLDEIVGNIRTNSLYLSKLERRFGEVNASNSANNATEKFLEELLALMRTNNLYIAKLERRLIELEQGRQKENSDADFLQQLRSNTLQLAKIDRKTNEILNTNQGAGSGVNFQNLERRLEAIIANKIEAILNKKLANVRQSNGGQPGVSSPQNLGEVMENLMKANHQLAGIEHKIFSLVENSQHFDGLARNIKSNNLYLTRLEQQLVELMEKLPTRNY